MRLSGEAIAQIAELRSHYRRAGRPEASRNLTLALHQAGRQITAGDWLPAPRAYPQLAKPGEVWTKAGRYWFACSAAEPFIILAVFYETADMPGRR